MAYNRVRGTGEESERGAARRRGGANRAQKAKNGNTRGLALDEPCSKALSQARLATEWVLSVRAMQIDRAEVLR